MSLKIIPDVHGRDFYKSILKNTTDKIIFLGDYEDPYPHEGFTLEDVKSAMMDIFSFAQDNPDRVILLLGNHSLPYYWNSRGYARWDWAHADELHQIYEEFKDLFKIAYWDEDTQTLFTHAGVTFDWWNDLELPIDASGKDIANTLNVMLKTDPESLETIGRSRGGYSRHGSCVWAHVTEHDSEDQMPFKQIFGHSQLQITGNFIHQDNWWMCDSRAIFEYDGETLKLYNNVDSEQ